MGLLQWLQSVVTLNHFFTWDYVWKYLPAAAIVQGVILTVILAVISQVFGTLIGLLLYFLRRSNLRVLRIFTNGYIWFFRGTPLVVQILAFYTIFPYLKIARPLRAVDPFSAIGFTHGPGPVFLDSFLAAILALSLNEGAYMAEIVRAGIDAIDVGQLEAAKSLGMTYGTAMRRIILPQAFRIIIPPLGNEFNSMMKNTSLVYTIGVYELFADAEQGYSQTFHTEYFVAVAFWYLVLTTIWTFIQAGIERRLGASDRGDLLTLRERLLAAWNPISAWARGAR